MKICLTTKYKDWDCSHTGKGLFVNRLIPALEKQGCTIVSPDEYADIDLQIGKHVWKPNAKKSVVRFGAVHIDKNSDYKTLNKRKAKALKKADGVVYQSLFSMEMCNAFLGEAKCPVDVIYNGADPAYYKTPKKAVSPYSINFVASARVWTKRKRLKTIIKSFLEADIPDSCLWVAGKTGNVLKGFKYSAQHAKVNFTGLLNERQLGRLYRLCNGMIHLVWGDACPNTVVEALNAGCPVITNEMSGTAELIWSNGYVLSEEAWDFKPKNLKNIPKIKHLHLIESIKALSERRPVDAKHLNIDKIASRYISFFKEILNG